MESPFAQRRLTSLDVFRGITIALMILVNNPGGAAHQFSPTRKLERLDPSGSGFSVLHRTRYVIVSACCLNHKKRMK